MVSLRDKLGVSSNMGEGRQKRLYEKYGVLENPFPPSHKTAGNPHQPLAADEFIDDHIVRFMDDGNSQVIVVTGTQGLGKTNLLEHYERNLPPVLRERGNFYVVRYYTDPEPNFGAVVRRIFQELGVDHLKRIAQEAKDLTSEERADKLRLVNSRELRFAFTELFRYDSNEPKMMEFSKLLLDYLMGLRVYKKHEELGLQHRLETTEAKTQALRDVIYLSHAVGALNGLFLFLDELEKMDLYSKQVTVTFLSSIRALIDALPQHLFLALAMTPDARDRYTRDFPALQGRLQQTADLHPLKTEAEAILLYDFYLTENRKRAFKSSDVEIWQQGDLAPLSETRVKGVFDSLLQDGLKLGVNGVIQRRFLDRLHRDTEMVFSDVS